MLSCTFLQLIYLIRIVSILYYERPTAHFWLKTTEYTYIYALIKFIHEVSVNINYTYKHGEFYYSWQAS